MFLDLYGLYNKDATLYSAGVFSLQPTAGVLRMSDRKTHDVTLHTVMRITWFRNT